MSESLATKIETDDLQQSHGLYHFVSLQNAIPIPEYRLCVPKMNQTKGNEGKGYTSTQKRKHKTNKRKLK